MPEEYTGPKRCDLCRYEKDAPCTTRDCNSVNGLAEFEPKGSETEETGCTNCGHWRAVKIGVFCPDCGRKLQ